MIEVAMVILLLGTLSLIVVSRMDTGTSKLMTTADKLTSHVRLVQTIAMNSSPGIWGVCFESSPQSYYMFHCADKHNCNINDDIHAIPGSEVDGNDRAAVSDGNVQIIADIHVAYDEFGRPHQISGGQAAETATPITLSLTDQSGNSHDIQIAPKTGFIP